MVTIWLVYVIFSIRKNIFACLLSVHNTINLSRYDKHICSSRGKFIVLVANKVIFKEMRILTFVNNLTI